VPTPAHGHPRGLVEHLPQQPVPTFADSTLPIHLARLEAPRRQASIAGDLASRLEPPDFVQCGDDHFCRPFGDPRYCAYQHRTPVRRRQSIQLGFHVGDEPVDLLKMAQFDV